MNDDSQLNAQATKTKATSKKQLMMWSCVMLLLVIAGIVYYFYSKYHPSTDDAYVQAHVVNIATQVSGPVAAIYTKNNQFVRKGQPLIDIDARPFEATVKQANAELSLAQQDMEVNSSAIKVARAELNKAEASLTAKERNFRRIATLVSKQQASIAKGDEATADYKTATAAVIAAANQLKQAKQQLGDTGSQNAKIRGAQAKLDNAKINLAYTHIVAPADGYLANFKVRVGNMVSAHQILFELVENKLWWVDANFKETQMELIKPGQAVTVTVDMYPSHKFKGHVDSISRGSGSVFSLLPPENATGNWVKVTQRFPVRIIIDNPSKEYPLRVGSSSMVKVETSSLNKTKPKS